jgi:hypothetical protein
MQQTPITPTDNLPERDAAPYIGFSRDFLRAGRRKGTGPAYIKVGRSIRYRREDLDTWLAKHRIEPRRA